MISKKNNNQWFEKWFDSPYYHTLYKNRDNNEAALFLNHVCKEVISKDKSHILDLACGKGRHSYFLADKGHIVTGLDLSPKSIDLAKKHKAINLKFRVHDMRKEFGTTKYDHILNLFTSFGYFENEKENISVMKNIQQALKIDGTVLIDFMNTKKAIENLIVNDEFIVDNVKFTIKRWSDKLFIRKQIKVQDQDKKYMFEERVQALNLNHFENYFEKTGLKLIRIFGDYNLNEFNLKKSDRLIMLAKK